MVNLKRTNYFTDSYCWVTGASSGIGRELALQLSQLGAKLILTARNEDQLNELKKECVNSNEHIVLAFDLSDEKALEDSFNSLNKRGVEIDFLFSNAGCSQRALALDTDMSTSRYLMNVNYFSSVHLIKLVLPQMIERQKGHIIVVSSLMGKITTPLRSSYAAAKHALNGYFESIITENYNSPIKFTLVNPGFIDTNISKNSLLGNGQRSDDVKKKERRLLPLKLVRGRF